MGLKEWLIPQDKVFFQLILKQSKNVSNGADLLAKMVKDFDSRLVKKRKEEIGLIELECDRIVHEVYEKLNTSFITPMDHSDITSLVSKYDTVMDLIYTVANRVYLFKIKPNTSMEKLSELIKESVSEIDVALSHIEKLNQKEITKRCLHVHDLENDADILLDESLAKLFKTGNVNKIIKMKEIYEFMELITDKCKEISHVINDIVIKSK